MTTTRLLYDSTQNSDLHYLLGMEIPDKCFYLENGSKKYVFLDKRELGVFEEQNSDPNTEVVALEPLLAEVRERGNQSPLSHRLATLILERYGQGPKIEVAETLPLSMADHLREVGYDLRPLSSLAPAREFKNAKEKGYIAKAIERTTRAFARIEAILQESQIEGEQMIYQGEPLTSEFLKREVNRVLVENDLLSVEGMIIAGGRQSAKPHHRGRGVMAPNVPIICDLFPRDMETGYFADMTRTYVKGRASQELQALYQAVLTAQELALNSIKSGVEPAEVHHMVCQSLIEAGFETGERGFVHGTGHGLGLDLHETPYIKAQTEGVLQTGQVVTVEPGLYYPELGGVRIEDVVYVTDQGCENLTAYPKELKEL